MCLYLFKVASTYAFLSFFKRFSPNILPLFPSHSFFIYSPFHSGTRLQRVSNAFSMSASTLLNYIFFILPGSCTLSSKYLASISFKFHFAFSSCLSFISVMNPQTCCFANGSIQIHLLWNKHKICNTSRR